MDYNDYVFDMDSTTWMLNYNFKDYYGLPIDQPINTELMEGLQKKISSDPVFKKKYGDKARISGGGAHYVCETYDSRTKMSACGLTYGGMRDQIDQLLKVIQGPWGAYGNSVE